MSDRQFRAEQWLYAFVITACGFGVGVSLAVQTVSRAIDKALMLPKVPR